MGFKPRGENLLVRPIQEEKVSPGGIVLPDSAQEKPTSGEVLKNTKKTAAEFSIGDVVVYKKYAGLEWEVDGEKLLILPVDQVVGFKE